MTKTKRLASLEKRRQELLVTENLVRTGNQRIDLKAQELAVIALKWTALQAEIDAAITKVRFVVETAPQYGEWQLIDTLNKTVVRRSFDRAALQAEINATIANQE